MVIFKLCDCALVDANIDGQVGVGGSARYQLTEELLAQSSSWEAQYGGWLYIFQFQGAFALALDPTGAMLHVDASADFTFGHTAKGTVGLTWSCTSDRCTETRNHVNLTFTVKDSQQYAAQVNIQLTPYADVNFAAEARYVLGCNTYRQGQSWSCCSRTDALLRLLWKSVFGCDARWKC